MVSSTRKPEHQMFNDEEYDGFGTYATKCARADCDAQIVRPGKTQCRGDSDDIGCSPGQRPSPLDILAARLDDLEERLIEAEGRIYMVER